MLFREPRDIDVRPLHFVGAALRGETAGGGTAVRRIRSRRPPGSGLPARFRPVRRHSERNHVRRRGVHGTHGYGPHRRPARPHARAAHARARGRPRTRADGKIIRHIAGPHRRRSTLRSVRGLLQPCTAWRIGFRGLLLPGRTLRPTTGSPYLPARVPRLRHCHRRRAFVALVVGRCEFLCEYQDEIDEVYHGLFEKRI